MGIFGALNTSVTGMRAQSFALENISGNIANSQTTAYKRIDTSFVDLIPSSTPGKQLAGKSAPIRGPPIRCRGTSRTPRSAPSWRSTATGSSSCRSPRISRTTGRSSTASTSTPDAAISGPDKNGYLVNGAGYYLMGIPVDATTGNLVGSVPQLLQFQSDYLPAQATTRVDYRANLASYPRTAASDPDIPGSELLQQANYAANPDCRPAAAGAHHRRRRVAAARWTGGLDRRRSISARWTPSAAALIINGTTITIDAGDDAAAILQPSMPRPAPQASPPR